MAAIAENKKDDYQFNVLVVDDVPTILALLKEVMSMVPGCNVTTASQPSEAMKTVVKSAIDIVFTDVHMPGVTGLEMLRDIISLDQSPEVIVMTAFPSGEIAQQAMELGATSLLSKPFENISLVEVELEKAIKRILRQRSSPKQVAEKKAELAQRTPVSAPDNDPVMKLSLPAEAEENGSGTSPYTAELTVTPQPQRVQVAAPERDTPEKVYEHIILDPLLQIEAERCRRYTRQFVLGYVDIPENFGLITQDEQVAYRQKHLAKIEACIRRSDVLIDAGREGAIVVGFECNRLGAEVIAHKLMSSGYNYNGFAVYPTESDNMEKLKEIAKKNLQSKRKYQILLYEQEEFFGRLIQSMLSDPKYDVTWTKSPSETYQLVNRRSEELKMMIMTLTKEPTQWQLMAKCVQENLVRWPVLLFTNVALSKELREKIRHFGVRAIVNKGISQEEFLYIVQSFVVPKPAHEERKNPRSLVTLPVNYSWGGQTVSSNTFTLSRDGLFIRDLNPPPSGTTMQLEIFVPGMNEPLKARAEVLYVVPYFVGVNRFHVPGIAAKFVGLDEVQKDRLESLVLNSRTGYMI